MSAKVISGEGGRRPGGGVCLVTRVMQHAVYMVVMLTTVRSDTGQQLIRTV